MEDKQATQQQVAPTWAEREREKKVAVGKAVTEARTDARADATIVAREYLGEKYKTKQKKAVRVKELVA